MSEIQVKFQQLLRELFQFDCADLDFGIYRIMNYKRAVVERFINAELPQAISGELVQGALADQSQAMEALDAARQKVLETLSDDALDAEGNLLDKYSDTKAGREYLEAQTQATGTRDQPALEAAIYNHLYTFFSRYYQDGDFISKRRYSKRERYAIPYNGEEVYLYWANHDQYYIKTAEYFTDYAYKAPNGVTAHFKLRAADVEQDNVKGDKRFFLPCPKAIAWDEDTDELIIPFEYRPLTAQEAITYGKRNQQDSIIEQALEEIPQSLAENTRALAALTAKRREDADGAPVSYLAHHLHQYTRRNTSDFFIHKDLRGFLSRELDFYLKNEVLNLAEMEAAGEDLAEAWFQMLRLIKRVGNHIITFLAQIEEFQKMLWEKRKFVTETFYCITVSRIDAAFYPEIAACAAQWAEWQTLVHIDVPAEEEDRVAFLKAHPTLVLDTRHFAASFVDRLLASYDDLDEMTDGLLVHSENWQALNLLREKYRERVKCIYIDPPYNSAASEILYKNDYKHSSWLSLLENRLRVGRLLLRTDGIQCTTIDDNEFHRLRELIAHIFGEDSLRGVVIIKNNPSGRSTVKGISIAHEYAIFSARSYDASLGMIPRSKKQLSQYPEEDEVGRFQWRNFLRAGGANDFRSARPRLHYPLLIAGNEVKLPQMNWNEQSRMWTILEEPTEDEEIIWPTSNGIEYTWRLGVETIEKRIDDLRVRRTQEGHITMGLKFRMDEEGILAKTVWDQKRMNATAYGTTILRHIMGVSQAFSFPKSVYAVEKSLRVCSVNLNSIALDYFAGSGTTGHAVINLNREDGGRRKFLLVEMGDYFDTVLLPRIKRVTFAPKWKRGKAKRMATEEEAERSPRLVKVIRLESYEDALNNITFDEAAGQQTLRFEDYLLQYMLRWETRRSASLLNVEKLAKSFSYQLHLHREGETRTQSVDLPETFNYLLGLDVQTRKVYDDDETRYLVYRGVLRSGRTVAVIWRETAGWTQDDYERDRDFVTAQKMTDGADEVFVNGDSFIPRARALEEVFKARMFATMEA